MDLVLVTVVLAVAGFGTAAWAVSRVVGAIREGREQAARGRSLQLMALFAPGIAAAGQDPRALLAWQPLATTARNLFPSEFAALDDATGATFPFAVEQMQAAHARITAEWLAWERAHDTEYKLKAAVLEAEPGAARDSPVARARLEAVEREKLERYQRRYEDYTRVSKALYALIESRHARPPGA